jgi:choline-sulfatase
VKDRPNFVIVMAEHFGANICPGYGETPVVAPNIEAFARESACFDEAYCASPVCGPSRYAFLTGNYVFNTGAYDNGSTIPPDVPTFAHLLNAHGYETAMCGRMHIHGLDQHRGFEQRLVSEIIDPRVGVRADWPGDHLPIAPLAEARDVSLDCPVSDSPLFRHDDCVTKRACAFLHERSSGSDHRPFCLTVGYLACHPGSDGKPEYKALYDMYMKMDFPVPAFSEDDYRRLPEHAKRFLQYGRRDQSMFDPGRQKHALARLFARWTYLDRQLGHVLEALRESGRDRDTYVVLTGDHGDNAGVNGIWGKMTFYQGAQRVPLIVRVPGSPDGGRHVPGRVSLIDVLPTLAELAGTEPSFPVDGISFALALTAGQDAPRGPDGAIFSEYHGYLSPTGMYMLLKGDYKYCHYLAEPCELFDLSCDPEERRNLLAEEGAEEIRAEMESELRKIVDIERIEVQVKRHNRRRQAVYDGVRASDTIEAALARDIRRFREDRDEPWWDGGEYMAREHSKHAERLARERAQAEAHAARCSGTESGPEGNTSVT